MALKNSIFDGFHEKKLFGHLKSMWEKQFNIYPQLPLTKIFNIESLNVNDNEKDFLLKTNIDYTVCDKNDKPLMCIEFDGLSGGYNRGGEYVQIKKDPSRKRKLELKLRIALEHYFPFYIVSFEEKKHLAEGIHLTVVDGIIGQTIAQMKFQDTMKDCVENSRDILSSMDESGLHAYIDDLAISTEIELGLTWDPIAKKAAEYLGVLLRKGIMSGYNSSFILQPEMLEVKDDRDINVFKNRLNSWNEVKWEGWEVSCKTPKGKVTERAWVRNFRGMPASPLIIAKNIAEFLAFYKAATLNGLNVTE